MKGIRNKSILFILIVLVASLCLMAGCKNGDDDVKATSSPSATAKTTATAKATSTADATEAPTTAPASPTPLKLTDPPEGYDANDKASAADIFDLTFENGEAKDQSAAKLELTAINDPKISTDPLINKTVAEFEGSQQVGENVMFAAYGFGANYHETLAKGFSFEVYAKITDDSQYGTLLGYMQAGGVGIDFDPTNSANDYNTGNNSSIGFGVYDAGKGGYVFLYAEDAIKTDRYYHVVGTYDGSKICLYYDGVLIKEAPVSGTLSFPKAEVSQYLGIGGDTGETDQGELAMNGALASARIYSSALTPSQVYNLYLDAVQ